MTAQWTDAVAIDCVMVGAGRRGGRDLAARVTIVNEYCQPLFDVYVKHKIKIKDYRTATTHLTPAHFDRAQTYKVVRRKVADCIRKRILVGYKVEHILRVLRLTNRYTKDVYQYLRTSRTRPTLQDLAAKHLRIAMRQNGVHNSIENACVAMKLYKMYKEEWEYEEYDEEDEEEDDEEEYYYSSSSSD